MEGRRVWKIRNLGGVGGGGGVRNGDWVFGIGQRLLEMGETCWGRRGERTISLRTGELGLEGGDPASLKLGLDGLGQGEGTLVAGARFGGAVEGGEGVS
jgi:hypothetical protein